MTTAEDNSTLKLAVERPYVGQVYSPRMGELGNSLSRARRARAITLEDVERDTHVSRRYLQALENEDFEVFPAPVGPTIATVSPASMRKDTSRNTISPLT